MKQVLVYMYLRKLPGWSELFSTRGCAVSLTTGETRKWRPAKLSLLKVAVAVTFIFYYVNRDLGLIVQFYWLLERQSQGCSHTDPRVINRAGRWYARRHVLVVATLQAASTHAKCAQGIW